MIKAFWEGFVDGFTRASKYGIPIALALVAGLALGSYSHPYEVCKRNGDCKGVQYIPAQAICEDMYNTDEDIGECVWILENP